MSRESRRLRHDAQFQLAKLGRLYGGVEGTAADYRDIERMDALRWTAPFFVMILSSGCMLAAPREYWHEPGMPCPQAACGLSPCADFLREELERAVRLDASCSPEATGHYLRVLEGLGDRSEPRLAGDDRSLRQLSNHCLARALICAQRHRQYVPGTGIVVASGEEPRVVPVRLVGPPWFPEDVQQIFPVGDYQSPSLTRSIRRCGQGLPVVAGRVCPTGNHPADSFIRPGTKFALTAVFRSSAGETPESETAPAWCIELHNPLSARHPVHDVDGPSLAADSSAPLVFDQATGSHQVDPFSWFIHAEKSNGKEGLFFLEPYQPGKIPVILIHGLLSSPNTWVDMANELRNMPGFTDRFQLWGFRYATGQPFVTSAAMLRKNLNVALAELRQATSDPALDQIVLIGHSMGGLIAKAQVSCSGDAMWRSVANRPLSQIVADQKTRDTFQEQFYFAPQPSIRRVVYIAAPHGGSTLATRCVGQVGSFLVSPEPTVKDRHRRLIDDNPDVFSREVRRRIPTSIDLLESRSEILQALRRLPVNASVKSHSIIGNGRYTLGDGRGDGVVGIPSARHAGVVSELLVPSSHTEIHRQPESICEVWRILCEHAEESRGGSTPDMSPITNPVAPPPEPAAPVRHVR